MVMRSIAFQNFSYVCGTDHNAIHRTYHDAMRISVVSNFGKLQLGTIIWSQTVRETTVFSRKIPLWKRRRQVTLY